MRVDMGKRVLVIARSYEETDSGSDRLRNAGFEIVRPPGGPGLSRDALVRAIADVDGAIIGTQRFDAELLDANGRLRVIVKAGAGIDNIDLDAADAAGIAVGAASGANAGAVAEYAVSLMLAVGRRICEVNTSVRRGEWERFRGVDLTGSTVGVIGLGHVGRGVCRLLRGFDVNLLGYDIRVDDDFAASFGINMTAIDDIVKRSDFITLHAPLTEATYHLIDRKRLDLMRPVTIVINTARGELIDSDALYDALAQRTIRGAGLDVFENEPLKDERFYSLDNVVLSSHNASYSTDGIERTAVAAADELIAFLGKT